MKENLQAAGHGVPPAIVMSARDQERLIGLATAAASRMPDVAAALLGEAERAEVVPADALPDDVVAMGSAVTFRDDATGTVRTVRLVYPPEADIAAGRVSVLTQIGAALIGLRPGQTIAAPTRAHPGRTLTVLRVGGPPPTS